jgi:hypothetical protein
MGIAPVEIAKRQTAIIAAGFGEGDGLGLVVDGLVIETLQAKRVAPVAVGLHHIGLEVYGIVIVLDRPVELALVFVGVAAVDQCGWVFRR